VKADLKALSKLLRPMSEEEERLVASLSWLEVERLPDSIRDYFIRSIEETLERIVSPDEWSALKGCGSEKAYRAAYAKAVQEGKFQK
jgi:hypothetical protein